MDAKEYFKQKAIEGGYEDFLHYCDCSHEAEQERDIPKWAEEYHQSQLPTVGEVSDEERKILIELLTHYEKIYAHGGMSHSQTDEISRILLPLRLLSKKIQSKPITEERINQL